MDDRGMAVAALQRVVGPHARPFALGEVPPNVKKRLARMMVPKMWPQTSLEACILRAIFRVQSCGTWQSGQFARTPDRLVKWMVACNSSKTLCASRGS